MSPLDPKTRRVCPCCRQNSPVPARVREVILRFGASVQWACQDCIESSAALEADPDQQTFNKWPPYLAYFDTRHECRDCGDAFVFAKDEKKHWYEVLQFWVQSHPVRCKSCNARHKGKQPPAT